MVNCGAVILTLVLALYTGGDMGDVAFYSVLNRMMQAIGDPKAGQIQTWQFESIRPYVSSLIAILKSLPKVKLTIYRSHFSPYSIHTGRFPLEPGTVRASVHTQPDPPETQGLVPPPRIPATQSPLIKRSWISMLPGCRLICTYRERIHIYI